MLNPVKIELDNYIIFEGAVLDLSKDGIYFLTGRNLDDEGYVANKVGKSVLVSSVSWILYGETPNNLTGDAVLGIFDNDCRGALHGDVGNERYVIARYRKHKKFGNKAHIYKYKDKNGEITKENLEWLTEGMRVKDVNQKIESLVGYNKSQFFKVIFHQQSHYDKFAKKANKKFLMMGAAERQDFLLFLINAEWVDKAREVAQNKLKVVEAEITRNQTAITLYTNKVDEKERVSKDVEENLVFGHNQETVITNDIERLKDILKEAEEADDISILQDRRTQLNNDISRHDKIQRQITHDKDMLERDIKSKIGMLKARIKECNLKIHRIIHDREQVMLRTTCPTCLQTISEMQRKKIVASGGYEAETRKIKTEITKTKIEIEEYEQKLQQAIPQYVKNINTERNNKGKCYKKLEDVEAAIAGVKTYDVDGYQNSLRKREQDLETCRHQLKKWISQIESLGKDISVFKEKIKDAEVAVESKTKEARYYQFYVENFGRKKLKATILDDKLEEIVSIANEVLEDIDFGNMSIDISNEKGETEFVIYDKSTTPKSLNMLCGREMAVLELAIDAAIEQIAHGEGSAAFAIRDEAKIEALDDEGIGLVLDFYKRLLVKTIIISHRPELKDNFDNIIYVVKENGIARIEQST